MNAGNARAHQPRTVAEQVDHLFRTVYPAGGAPLSYRTAAAKINELAGERVISSVYLQQIRTGARPTPSHEKLSWIARLFGVPVSYFSDEQVAERVDQQLATLTEWRDAGVRAISLLASGLSPEALESIKTQLHKAREREGLPEITE